jgi:hypothetical protein
MAQMQIGEALKQFLNKMQIKKAAFVPFKLKVCGKM